MYKLFLFAVSSVIIIYAEAVILSQVPVHLLECYRGGGPPLSAPRRLDVFLSLVRRLELDSRLDMRLFSTALLRSLRLDGIEEAANVVETEFILPYRASAFQFNRYKLLMELFLPSQNLLNVDEILSTEEKCILHKMLSSAVRPWERGDENVVCPLSAQQRQPILEQGSSRARSRCPIEDGVIETDWGTISPGILIAALASSLEAQRVTITDILTANVFRDEVSQSLVDSAMEDWYAKTETFELEEQSRVSSNDISNMWVATLAGDLAEVVVNQGPIVGPSSHDLLVGSNNRWNDTLLPRDYYLFPQNGTTSNWHFTDAEILAGIDGLILANYLPTWLEQRRSLRLSQVIEMYYSDEGVSFDQRVRACNRLTMYRSIVNGTQLFTETSRFAHMLALQQITVYIPRDEMERLTNAALAAFLNYLPSILQRSHVECRKIRNVPSVDLIIATDGTWKGYEHQQFISWVSGAVGAAAGIGSVSLLHGNTGQWLAPPGIGLIELFSYLHNTTDWPHSLNLPNVISRIIQISRNRTLQEIADMISAGRNTVVLVISPTDRPSAAGLERARELMASLRRSFFDIYFAYVAQDLSDFQNVNNEYLDYSELFLRINSKSVVDVINSIDIYLLKNIIPSRIVGAQCPVNATEYLQIPYEDFVLPGHEQYYRIHPFYLRQQSLINVQFRNDGHGTILVCHWRGAEESRSCQTMVERAVYTFNLSNPCPSPEFCPPAHFFVSALNTKNLCANIDCRLPNQVGYYIQHSGFRCLPLLGAADSVSPFWKVYALSLMISLLYII